MSVIRKLTDTTIVALKAKDKEYRIADIAGLYIRVQASGKKSWQLRRKNEEGKWSWIGLGPYPKVSLKNARSQTLKYQSGELQIVTRADRLKQAIREENELFEHLMWEWLDTKKMVWQQATFKKEVQSIEKHLLPVFGHRPYKEITSKEWLEFFQTKQRKLKIFNRIEKLISYCRNAYDYAVFNKEMTYNPLTGIQKFLDKSSSSSMKHIDVKELPEMVNKIRSYRSEEISICLELLIHMFPRPGELRQAQWSQFDFEKCVWIRPGEIMKKGIEHGIPMSDQVLALLTRLKAISKRESNYLFPARDSVNKSISNLTFNAALNRMGYFGKQNPHGFRHIASTQLNDEFSDRSQVIESALAHLKSGVKGAYDKGAHLKERRDIMQYWSDYLDGICGGREFSKLKSN